MRPRPLRVAITGGIATGKSHCLTRFAEQGAPVIDADVLARDVIAPGTPGANAVLARFGTLDRKTLGDVVFHDAQARADLEAIIHPLVYEAINDWFSRRRHVPFGIAAVPLLVETGHLGAFDRVLITSCRPEQQRERLMARGLTPADADARIAAQMPFEEKLKQARANGAGVDVIDTSGSLDDTNRQVNRIIDVLGSLPPRVCS